jgi:hypothetical protein
MARRRHPERSVPGAAQKLLSAAYGHLGCFHLWSLGLVALYALGAAPVFLVAGLLAGAFRPSTSCKPAAAA